MAVEPGITLTKEEVLKKISEEQIFEKYLQLPVEIGVSYINPLRIDANPGCRYYYNNSGRLRFKDFSKGDNYDCFSLVQSIYNCNFIDALRIIVKDFRLNGISDEREQVEQIQIKRSRYNIKISTKEWNLDDINYFNKYNIFGDNLYHDTYACKAIWINDEYYRCRSNDPCYAYYFGNELYKLYFPRRKSNRFFTNITLEDQLLQGYNSLPTSGELLIVTKSYKDVKSMRSFDLYAVAPQSETQYLNENQFRSLQDRFNTIICVGDNDSAGRNFMLHHYHTYNIPSFMFPWTMEKDFSDNVARFGVEYMKNLINQLQK